MTRPEGRLTKADLDTLERAAILLAKEGYDITATDLRELRERAAR